MKATIIKIEPNDLHATTDNENTSQPVNKWKKIKLSKEIQIHKNALEK
jgi:hypothetical protein